MKIVIKAQSQTKQEWLQMLKMMKKNERYLLFLYY